MPMLAALLRLDKLPLRCHEMLEAILDYWIAVTPDLLYNDVLYELQTQAEVAMRD